MTEPKPGDVARPVELYALKFCGRIRWHYIHSSPNHLRKMVMQEYLQQGSEYSWESMCEQHPEIDFQIVKVTVSESVSVPAAPQGETVTVECAVIVDGNHLYIRGNLGESAGSTFVGYSGRNVATAVIQVPKSLLSVPTLPTVEVNP